MATYAPVGEYYHANGGCCYLCGKPDHLVDTGVQIVGEGVLAICVSCVKELALIADPEAAFEEAEQPTDELEALAALNTRLAQDLKVEHKLTVKLRKELRDAKVPVDA